MTAAFPDKASLQASLTEWYSDHAAAEATALSFTTAVRTSQVLHMINEALGAVMKWVGLPRPAPPNARLPQACASVWRGHRYVAGLCRCAQMAACFAGVALGAGKASIESSSSQTFSNRSRGRLKRAAVPASACAAKQRTKVARLVFGLLLTLAGKASAFSDKGSLQVALGEWCADAAAAQATHGPVSAWDVSAVTDMEKLLYLLPSACRSTFDEDLNAWDVGQVTTMDVRSRPRREPEGLGWWQGGRSFATGAPTLSVRVRRRGAVYVARRERFQPARGSVGRWPGHQHVGAPPPTRVL